MMEDLRGVKLELHGAEMQVERNVFMLQAGAHADHNIFLSGVRRTSKSSSSFDTLEVKKGLNIEIIWTALQSPVTDH